MPKKVVLSVKALLKGDYSHSHPFCFANQDIQIELKSIRQREKHYSLVWYIYTNSDIGGGGGVQTSLISHTFVLPALKLSLT